MGIAIGAFHWSVSPWYVALKQALAGWLADHHVLWPLTLQPPWWILTDYPSVNDQMAFLDGGVLLAYIMATAIGIGAAVSLCLWLAARSLGPSPGAVSSFRAKPHPYRGVRSVFRIERITVTMLRAEGLSARIFWPAAGSVAWIAGLATANNLRRFAATVCVALAVSTGAASWVVFFWVWQ
jgi:hypothetical protein